VLVAAMAALAMATVLALGAAATASCSASAGVRPGTVLRGWHGELAADRLLPQRWRDRREQRAFEVALPSVLEAMAGHLRSGASLRVALLDAIDAAPACVAVAMRELAGSIRSGAPLAQAVDAWAVARNAPSTRLASAAIGLAAATGGAPARSLDAVAATLRDRIGLAREIRSASAQARMSTAVVGAAPLGFVVVAGGLDPRTVGFLLTTPVGLTCLATGIGLDVLGLLWMRRLAEGAAR
jgi:tight adherence protein B